MSEPVTDDRRRRFERMYEASYGPVVGYVMRRVGSPDDAADVIAETFLTAWRRLDDVPAGEAARPWLFGVARRVLANQGRAERRRIALGERLRSELAAARYGREPSPGLRDAAAASPTGCTAMRQPHSNCKETPYERRQPHLPSRTGFRRRRRDLGQ